MRVRLVQRLEQHREIFFDESRVCAHELSLRARLYGVSLSQFFSGASPSSPSEYIPSTSGSAVLGARPYISHNAHKRPLGFLFRRQRSLDDFKHRHSPISPIADARRSPRQSSVEVLGLGNVPSRPARTCRRGNTTCPSVSSPDKRCNAVSLVHLVPSVVLRDLRRGAFHRFDCGGE